MEAFYGILLVKHIRYQMKNFVLTIVHKNKMNRDIAHDTKLFLYF